MSRVGTAHTRRGGLARTHCTATVVALLGVAQLRPGKSCTWLVGVGQRRRHGFSPLGLRAVPFGAGNAAAACLVGARVMGVPAVPQASEATPPFSCPHRSEAATASHNKSVQTDRVTAGCACLRASADLQR